MVPCCTHPHDSTRCQFWSAKIRSIKVEENWNPCPKLEDKIKFYVTLKNKRCQNFRRTTVHLHARQCIMEYTALVVHLIHPRKVIQTMYDGNLLLNIIAHISTDALVMILTRSLFQISTNTAAKNHQYLLVRSQCSEGQ